MSSRLRIARLDIWAALSVRCCRFSALTLKSFSSTVSALQMGIGRVADVTLVSDISSKLLHYLDITKLYIINKIAQSISDSSQRLVLRASMILSMTPIKTQISTP